MQTAGRATIFIPTGAYEFAGVVNMEVRTSASAAGTIRITGEGAPTLLQRDENNLFVVTDARDENAVGHEEGFAFEFCSKAS